jgi:hypothetical protein
VHTYRDLLRYTISTKPPFCSAGFVENGGFVAQEPRKGSGSQVRTGVLRVGNMVPMTCECDCGATVTPDARGRPRRFINGHNARIGQVSARGVKSWDDYPVPVRDPATGCLRWQGPITPSGYGKVGRRFAHVEAYRRSGRNVPDGHQVDHVWARGCRHRDCVEPEHLEAVTCAENNRRQPQHTARRARSCCKWGHDRTPETVYVDPRGKTRCRSCNAASQRKFKAKAALSTAG